MFDQTQPYAIYMEDSLNGDFGKMGFGIMRYSPHPIACVVDSTQAGKTVREACGEPFEVPIVKDIETALRMGAEIFVLGTAPSGGRLPDEWVTVIEKALSNGMSLINGLHDQMEDRFSHLVTKDNQKIWDIRVPGPAVPIARARAAKLSNKRVLMVGTDMAIGKMTAGLELYKWLLDKGVNVGFVATGQIGITITGKGIPLDAIKVDQAAAAVEHAVLEQQEKDVVIIEGQGSLLHPGSTATLPLMRGSCPTHLVLCHKYGKTHLRNPSHIEVPNLDEFIQLNETVANVSGKLSKAKTIGIAVNTFGVEESLAKSDLQRIEALTGIPTTDVIRYGVEVIGKQLL